MKGKIGQALEYSLPIISTSIGIEGMNLCSGKNVLESTNEAKDFAKMVISLYLDKKMWNSLKYNSSNAILKYNSEITKDKLSSVL